MNWVSRLLVAWMVLSVPAGGFAAEGTAARSDRSTVTLVSDTDAVGAGVPFRLGILFRLAPGWHIYWKNPGEAGAAPEADFETPRGTAAGALEWPAPTLVAEQTVVTYAYTGQVLLPLTVTPGEGAQHIVAHARWLICERLCVPEEADLTLDLPAGSPAPSAQAGLFAAAARKLPKKLPFAVTAEADGLLRAKGEAAAGAKGAYFFPGAADEIDSGAPQDFAADESGFTLRLKPGKTFRPSALDGVLRVTGETGDASYAVGAPPVAPAASIATQPAPRAPAKAAGLGWTLLLAVAGGLILNLMPCVFPVLAMKAVGLSRMHTRAAARTGALAYLAGVVVSFALLGAALIALRAGGAAAGWGFQFQSPAFVVGLAWLLFAVGLSFSGVFEVGGGIVGLGQGLASRGGVVGSFFTGVLAVVVATPCTAPFMGAALAAALAAPPVVALTVFVALGVGLALPYVLLAFVPAAARAMPRPGAWMDVFKQALAFPMYGAAAWLIWVASQQAANGVALALAGSVLVAVMAWAVGLSGRFERGGRRGPQAVAVLALVGAAALLPRLGEGPVTRAETGVEAYSAARLTALRAAGKPVFVNMTAAWCVTCLVNERVALSGDAVTRAFADAGVVYLKGDWTRGDPEVTAALRDEGRDGVPLYLFYRPGAARPDVLPQILTESTILDEVAQARREASAPVGHS